MILIADIHLGKESDSFLHHGIPVQRYEIYSRLCTIGDLCRETDQALVIAGDIFNKLNPTSQVISIWFQFLSNYPDIDTYIVPGNHDSGTEWVSMGMVDAANMAHVHVFLEPTVHYIQDSTGDASVLFYPHIPLSKRETTKTIADLWSDEVAFCVTHGQVTDSDYVNDIFFEAGDAILLDLSDIPGTVFAGHIHNQGEHSKGSAKVVYPGSLTINNFGEVDETKGYLEIPLSDSKKYKFRQFDDSEGLRWQHVELDLTEKAETGISEEAVKEIAENAIIKITVLAKQYGIVDEAYVRGLFNKYGYVTRYETKIVGDNAPKKAKKKVAVSHTKLLAEWLSETEDATPKSKALAKKLGVEIITEVLS